MAEFKFTYEGKEHLCKVDAYEAATTITVGGIRVSIKAAEYCCGATFIYNIRRAHRWNIRQEDQGKEFAIWPGTAEPAEALLHHVLTNPKLVFKQDSHANPTYQLSKCKLYFLDNLRKGTDHPRLSRMGLDHGWAVHLDQKSPNPIHSNQTEIVLGEWHKGLRV